MNNYKIKFFNDNRARFQREFEFFVRDNNIEIISFSHTFNNDIYRGILIYKECK